MNAKLSDKQIIDRFSKWTILLDEASAAEFWSDIDWLRALGQAADEPVAWKRAPGHHPRLNGFTVSKCLPDDIPLYLHPAEGAEALLAELVACKDLKERIEGFEGVVNGKLNREWDALHAEYERRKPLAWQAARKHVGGKDG